MIVVRAAKINKFVKFGKKTIKKNKKAKYKDRSRK